MLSLPSRWFKKNLFQVNLIEIFELIIDSDVVNTVTSKFHFVDLAGSERLAKTKAEGTQMKEGKIFCMIL